jgi:hypothetical protein
MICRVISRSSSRELAAQSGLVVHDNTRLLLKERERVVEAELVVKVKAWTQQSSPPARVRATSTTSSKQRCSWLKNPIVYVIESNHKMM